jgi:hypothetical protein
LRIGERFFRINGSGFPFTGNPLPYFDDNLGFSAIWSGSAI